MKDAITARARRPWFLYEHIAGNAANAAKFLPTAQKSRIRGREKQFFESDLPPAHSPT
jgi:hypothetical protein